jgi:hypothetical protein
MKSTHLADPEPQRPLKANGNESGTDSDAASNEELELPSKMEDGLNPAQRAQRLFPGLSRSKTF